MAIPRIALCGFILESNRFAPTALEADFRGRYYFEGDAILDEALAASTVGPSEMVAFVRTMNATGPWQPVPLILTGCQPAGPVEQAFFDATLDEMVSRLRAAGPVDGIFIANHGAMVSTGCHDPDGEMYARLRQAAGSDARIIGTLDLHANISDRMVGQTNLLVSYLTNPHVDMYERGEEAALAMRLMLAGTTVHNHFIRLPLTPPSVTLLTREGPYADMIQLGQRRKRELSGAIFNVSILGGFVFGDTPHNGVCVIVNGRNEALPARTLAEEIAAFGWSQRPRFKRALTPVAEATALALRAGEQGELCAQIHADSGDNPGGGGSGRTTAFLRAMVESGARNVLFGSFFDRPLAEQAHTLGEGAQFTAVFNRGSGSQWDAEYSVQARVRTLFEGKIIGRRGLYKGRTLDVGKCAALELGPKAGVTAIVISNRLQTADPLFFEMFGLDISKASTVCVKSRGHFRAGFDEWFAPERVLEIDTEGLTSPVLDRYQWRHLPRPVYPLDENTSWPAID